MMNRPDPNTYWVLPGRFLAGEYPGAADIALARQRLAEFIQQANINTFIDLTETHELVHYEKLLPTAGVEYFRLPIRDMNVPHSRQHMTTILNAVDGALARGRNVYVHCWGGIGRTGTTVGCWLRRHGRSPEDALAELSGFWQTVEKRHRAPRSPETREQADWVRNWSEELPDHRPSLVAAAAHPSPPGEADRYRGSLLGLAVGDALGTTVEFKAPGSFAPLTDIVGGGPFHLKPGQWTDDTSMALCLAESLLECKGSDARDQMDRYCRWWRDGYQSATGVCFDIGGTVSAALGRYLSAGAAGGDPFAGSTDPHAAGNGSLMRLAPVPLYFAKAGVAEAVARAAESSRTTHGAATAVSACRYMAALIVGALAGASKDELLAAHYTPPDTPDLWTEHPLAAPVAEVAGGSFRTKPGKEIRGTGYVVASLEAALWAFARAGSFEEGALLAVNLGEDADTTGAIYGQLAGAFYGESGIPARWLQKLYRREDIADVADRLRQAGSEAAGR